MSRSVLYWFCTLLFVACMSGCLARSDLHLTRAVYSGDLGRARTYMAEKVAKQPKPKYGSEGNLKSIDRSYLLNEVRLAIVTMADGYPDAAGPVIEETYEILRTQGINDDKTVAAVVINEDIKTWKGEPFEQAMTFCYIGMHYALQGDWGNMRAATGNSLFYLRDFGQTDAEALARKVAKASQKDQGAGDALFDDYEAIESNFTLGYLLNAIANQQVDRDQEAGEQYARVLAISPQLGELVAQLKAGRYNTIFVVDSGQGPQKTASGPDNAIAKFVPVDSSDGADLLVSVGGQSRSYRQVIDMNSIATDLMWNSLEDVRLAKSHLGSLLLAAGAGTAMYGGYRDSDAALIAGLAMMATGAVAKAGAHADTRYCEVIPQRVYVVPATITGPRDTVTLMVQGKQQTKLVLAGMRAPPGGAGAQLRYVRLVSKARSAPLWATSGQILYSNVHAEDAGQLRLPYILGGDDVRPPSYLVLKSYQDAGYLTGMTLDELENLYKLESIQVELAPGSQPGLHVLEGGNSLAVPLPGTAGYARLFGKRARPYRPKSREVRELAATISAQIPPQMARGNL